MKTSVYMPDKQAAVAKGLGLNLSRIWQQAVLEHILWATTPGPVRYYNVAGATVADILTLMTEASIPLNARLTVRREDQDGEPGVFIEWKELPQEANGDRGTDHSHPE
jgi:hypothetical protein